MVESPALGSSKMKKRRIAPSPQPVPQSGTALVNRTLDFWILGGLSVATWSMMALTLYLRPYSAVLSARFSDFGNSIGILGLLVQYPHFMASYKLGYGQGRQFILRNWVQLVFVPVALICFIVGAALTFSTEAPPGGWVLSNFLNGGLAQLGISPKFGLESTLGYETMRGLFVLYLVTAGWHGAKQAYGCMMVYGKWDGYRMTQQQRDTIRWTLFGGWFCFLVKNLQGETFTFLGAKYHMLGLPTAAMTLAECIFVLGLGSLLIAVLGANWTENRQLPSANFLVPLVALMLWYVPWFNIPEFVVGVSFFHGLQYLGFVYKLENTRNLHLSQTLRQRKLVALYAVFVLVGWLSIELLPDLVDRYLVQTTFPFVFSAVFVFVNIHHYYIDNVIWRFNNTEIREYLLK
jgi:hypothetical protein